jgi:hypothetical protein
MRLVYAGLGLEGFEQARGAIEGYVARNSDYRPNRYQPDPETRDQITLRWNAYIQKYGYASQAEVP